MPDTAPTLDQPEALTTVESLTGEEVLARLRSARDGLTAAAQHAALADLISAGLDYRLGAADQDRVEEILRYAWLAGLDPVPNTGSSEESIVAFADALAAALAEAPGPAANVLAQASALQPTAPATTGCELWNEPVPDPCPDCTWLPCEEHDASSPDLHNDHTYNGWQYGIRWASGDIAWWGPARSAVEARYPHPPTQPITSPLTGETGTLIARRVAIGPVHEVPPAPPAHA